MNTREAKVERRNPFNFYVGDFSLLFEDFPPTYSFFLAKKKKEKTRRETIIIFPFSLDNIVVDLSTYALFTFPFVHKLIDTQRPPTYF